MKERIESSRRKEIDIYKAIAIIMVVYDHVVFNSLGVYTGFVCFVHMPIFYFVSGFFMYNELSRYSEKELLIKKCRRLLVPYFAWSLISFLANALLLFLTQKAEANVLWDEAVQVFIYSRSVWFFIQLFLANLVFIVIHRIVASRIYRIAINLIVWGLLIVFCHTEWLRMWKMKWLYGFLLFGYVCAQYDILARINRLKFSIRCMLFTISFVGWIEITLFVCGAYDERLDYGFNQMYFSSETGLTGLAVWFCGLIGITTFYLASTIMSQFKLFDLLSQMGSYTLDIYVVHMLLIFVIKKIPLPEHMEFAVSFFLVIFIVCIPIYLLSKHVLRKIKLYRMITG